MNNNIGRFTIDPTKTKPKFISSKDDFLEDIIILETIGYKFPHYYTGHKITGYRAAVIETEDNNNINTIKKIYEITPNRIYGYKTKKHLVFYFKKSLNTFDYTRVTKALAFIYDGQILDYHFYPENGVTTDLKEDTLNENLIELCTRLFFFKEKIKDYQQRFTISDFDNITEVTKIPIVKIIESLYGKDAITIENLKGGIDKIHNIHRDYGYGFELVDNYFGSIDKTKLFFKENFKIDFNNTNAFDYTKSKTGVVITEGEHLFLNNFGYFTLDNSGGIKKLTDFYIKVHSKIVGNEGKVKFIVTLINESEGIETKKIIWENRTSTGLFSDFIQSYGPYHYYGTAPFIKEIHKQISTTKRVPEVRQVIGFGHHKEEGIIIFKNGIWDIKQRLFTIKKDTDDDFYYNYNHEGYWVTDKHGNDLSTILSDGVPILDTNKTVEIDDVLDFMGELYADNSGAYLIFLALGMMGYLAHGDKNKTFPLIFTRGVTGCVDSETEYLTPTGWKYIKDYNKGDIIGEFDKKNGKCLFNKPLGYIKEKDTRDAYRIKTKNIDMLLTEEHRILSQSVRGVYSTNRLGDMYSDLETHKNHHTNKYNIPTVFDIEDKKGLELSNIELQIMVAVIADGTFPRKNTGGRGGEYTCYIRIKKENKKDRLRKIFNSTDIYVEEKEVNDGFSVFKFDAPRRDKIFSSYYWGANKKQLKIIANEVQYWDGNTDKRNGSIHFYTTIKDSADFIQYALLITKQTRTSSLIIHRKGKTYGNNGQYIRTSDDLEVISTQQKRKCTRIEYKDIIREKLTDGNKYCFTTNTGYWVARRNGKIFITGNSGKSVFNELLQKMWGIKKTGTDFENSTVFTMTITLSYLIKFPYFIAEYREAATMRLQKVGTLRSVFDKISQTKGKADQSVVKYDYAATPVLDGEEMITDGALRTRSIQYQLLQKHKIKGNFEKILRNKGDILDNLLFTYLTRSNGKNYTKYLDEGYDIFKPFTSENRIAQNIANIYAGCMCFSDKDEYKQLYIQVLREVIDFQEQDVQENSTRMQIIKVMSKFLESSYSGIYVRKNDVVISWNTLEDYVQKNRIETSLKINSYKEHLMTMGYDIDFVEVEEKLIEGVVIPFDGIKKQLLVNHEVYKGYKIYKNGI